MISSTLIRLPEVKRRTGLSKSTIYRIEGEGRFPRRVQLGLRATAWREDEVQTWIESRPNANASGLRMRQSEAL